MLALSTGVVDRSGVHMTCFCCVRTAGSAHLSEHIATSDPEEAPKNLDELWLLMLLSPEEFTEVLGCNPAVVCARCLAWRPLDGVLLLAAHELRRGSFDDCGNILFSPVMVLLVSAGYVAGPGRSSVAATNWSYIGFPCRPDTFGSNLAASCPSPAQILLSFYETPMWRSRHQPVMLEEATREFEYFVSGPCRRRPFRPPRPSATFC